MDIVRTLTGVGIKRSILAEQYDDRQRLIFSKFDNRTTIFIVEKLFKDALGGDSWQVVSKYESWNKDFSNQLIHNLLYEKYGNLI